MKIAIVGTGYVGLVSGACFAEIGHEVTCVDVDAAKVDLINGGAAPIFEVGLDDLLRRHVGKRLRATCDLAGAVQGAEATFIAVGTPFDGTNIDLTYIRAVSRQVGSAIASIEGYHTVVVKSTVVPGTTDSVVRPLLEEASGKKAGIDFGVGMNPEFLTEGTAVDDFMRPDRIVVGGMDERTVEVLAGIYAAFPAVPIVRTNNKTAEMIKYTSNAVLAALISFSNEIGNLCARLGDIDVVDVMKGVHLARYFTSPVNGGAPVTAPITSFLYAGCGFGGSCLPKDVKALVAQGEGVGVRMPLLSAVLDINKDQPNRVIEIAERRFKAMAGVKVAILGLAFKPDTDDMRESPAIPIIDALLERGAVVSAYDPVATGAARRVLSERRVRFVDDLATALSGAGVAIIITSWAEFQQVPTLLASMEAPPFVIDGRRMLDRRTVKDYAGIGLGELPN